MTALEDAEKTRLTWNEWYARQQRIRAVVKHRQGQDTPPFGNGGLVPQTCARMPFCDPELARLSFVRWLFQRHLDSGPRSYVGQ